MLDLNILKLFFVIFIEIEIYFKQLINSKAKPISPKIEDINQTEFLL